MAKVELPFVNLYIEPTKDEYSIRSLPFSVETEYDKERTSESVVMKELQERINRLRGRLESIPSGEYNAIFGKVTTEKAQRGTYIIVATYTLYHLNTL